MSKSTVGRQHRDTYKYVVKRGNKVVYAGITNDLSRREREHRQIWSNARVIQAGRKTTREAALKWERKQNSIGITSSDQVRQAARLAIGLNREAIKELENH